MTDNTEPQVQIDEIVDDDDFKDEAENVVGLMEDAKQLVDQTDWVKVLEGLDEVQEIVGRLHRYATGKIE